MTTVKELETSVESSAWAKQTLSSLEKMSPTSLKVVYKQLTDGKNLPYDECFKMELRISQHFMQNSDFFEGVRAALVDKDKNPQWKPKTLAEVTNAEVNKYFQGISNELVL